MHTMCTKEGCKERGFEESEREGSMGTGTEDAGNAYDENYEPTVRELRAEVELMTYCEKEELSPGRNMSAFQRKTYENQRMRDVGLASLGAVAGAAMGSMLPNPMRSMTQRFNAMYGTELTPAQMLKLNRK